MKIMRVIAVGLMMSCIAFSVITIPFTHHLVESPLYAFLTGWNAGINSGSPSVTNLVIVSMSWCLSLATGMAFSSFIYSPSESFITSVIKKTTKLD